MIHQDLPSFIRVAPPSNGPLSVVVVGLRLESVDRHSRANNKTRVRVIRRVLLDSSERNIFAFGSRWLAACTHLGLRLAAWALARSRTRRRAGRWTLLFKICTSASTLTRLSGQCALFFSLLNIGTSLFTSLYRLNLLSSFIFLA